MYGSSKCGKIIVVNKGDWKQSEAKAEAFISGQHL